MPVKELRTYLFIYIYVCLLFAGNQLGCCCFLFVKSAISLERCEGCVNSRFLLKRKKHIFKGLMGVFLVVVLLDGFFFFLKERPEEESLASGRAREPARRPPGVRCSHLAEHSDCNTEAKR